MGSLATIVPENVKSMGDAGFAKLEELVVKLDQFGDKLVAELQAVRNELSTQQYPEQTIGNKMDTMITKCNTYDNKFNRMEDAYAKAN